MESKRKLLKHFLAALAYRTQKALRNAPEDFGSFRAMGGVRTPAELVRQMGPFSDAMTHAGQLALLRRLAGAPVPPENFIVAEIEPDRLGKDQPEPVSPDKNWPEAPPGWHGPQKGT
jgi:hypothetical protein